MQESLMLAAARLLMIPTLAGWLTQFFNSPWMLTPLMSALLRHLLNPVGVALVLARVYQQMARPTVEVAEVYGDRQTSLFNMD
ncbi:hypothetical protein OK016_27505 [Vibrio chagasii]|nr:hypothetical protein [Vibrio chagasii]